MDCTFCAGTTERGGAVPVWRPSCLQTKEQVLDAAFHHAVADSRRRSEAALAGVDEPWERFVALIEAHMPRADLRKEWLIWLQLWSEASVNESLRSLNEAHYREWIDLVEAIVRDGQSRGDFRQLAARDFTIRFLTMMDGLVIQLTMGSAEVDLGRLRHLLLGFAREQLLGEPLEPIQGTKRASARAPITLRARHSSGVLRRRSLNRDPVLIQRGVGVEGVLVSALLGRG